jgi:hypothetical protein
MNCCCFVNRRHTSPGTRHLKESQRTDGQLMGALVSADSCSRSWGGPATAFPRCLRAHFLERRFTALVPCTELNQSTKTRIKL